MNNFCLQPNLCQTEKLKTKGQADDGYWEYTGHRDAPKDGGYLAFYLEAMFEREGVEKGRPNSLRLSTEMNIIPNGFPYERCEGAACKGVLV